MGSTIAKTMIMTNKTNNVITTGLNHSDWKMETLFSLLCCIKNIEKNVRFYRLYHYKYKFELIKKVYIIYTCNCCTVPIGYLYNSLDCKEGHMKKNRLCVCVCVCLHLGSKEHRF